MDKHAILSETHFGRGTAELDDALRDSFVETDLWSDVFNGHVDLVYGAKGAGKSAIYSLLLTRSAQLRKRGVIVVGAENPQGEPAFQGLMSGPTLDDENLIRLWKLYFLTVIAEKLREMRLLRHQGASRLTAVLENEGLLP